MKRIFFMRSAQFLAIAFGVSIPLSLSVSTVLSLLLPVICALAYDKDDWAFIVKNPITVIIALFVFLHVIGCAYSIGANRELLLAVRKALRLLYVPIMLPLFTQLQWRNYALSAFLGAVLVSVAVAASHGWPLFKDPIFTSLFTSYAIFVLAHYAMDYARYRVLTIFLGIFLTFYLFFINTGRVGQVLFIMLFMLFMWQRFGFKPKIQAFAMSLLGAVLALSMLVPSTFTARQTQALNEIQDIVHSEESTISHESSLGIRFILAKNTWDLIKLKPIFGWGSGAFRAAYAAHAPEALYKTAKRTNPHNQYLLTWVELGLPGLCLLLTMFVAMLRSFNQPNSAGYLGVGLVLAIMAGCSMNSWLLDNTSAFFFVFVGAVCLAAMPQLAPARKLVVEPAPG